VVDLAVFSFRYDSSLIFLLPFLYYLAKKKHHLMLIMSFSINLAFGVWLAIFGTATVFIPVYFSFDTLFATPLGIW